MDDFVILHHNKKYLKYCLDTIINILHYKYKLDINNKKTKIDNIKNGIDFLGYFFSLKNNKLIVKIKNTTKKKFKTRIK